jgi:hypothetical protein
MMMILISTMITVITRRIRAIRITNNIKKKNRDLSLMVKYETFNLCYMGSNPIGLNLLHLIGYNYYMLIT